MSADFDYYEILGITKDANNNEIKKAYKKLAMKYHPDKNPENPEAATEMFKKIAEAYDTLMDPKKRDDYDNMKTPNQYDFDYYGKNSSGKKSSHRSNFPDHHFSREQAFNIFNHFFADMDDFHDRFFNDAFSSASSGSASASAGNRRSNRDGFRSSRDPFEDHFARTSSFMNAFRSDPFMSNPFGSFRGGGFGSPFDDFDHFGGGVGGSGGSEFSSSSSTSSFSSISYGNGATQRSTSTSTHISPDGTKRIRTETTIVYPDGHKETKVDEKVEESQNKRLGYRDSHNDSVVPIHRSGGKDSKSSSNSSSSSSRSKSNW